MSQIVSSELKSVKLGRLSAVRGVCSILHIQRCESEPRAPPGQPASRLSYLVTRNSAKSGQGCPSYGLAVGSSVGGASQPRRFDCPGLATRNS